MVKDYKIPFIKARIGRFSLLLAAILLLFVLRPFLEGYVGINILILIFTSLILFSAIFQSVKHGLNSSLL